MTAKSLCFWTSNQSPSLDQNQNHSPSQNLSQSQSVSQIRCLSESQIPNLSRDWGQTSARAGLCRELVVLQAVFCSNTGR